jgi:hypothetical protein
LIAVQELTLKKELLQQQMLLKKPRVEAQLKMKEEKHQLELLCKKQQLQVNEKSDGNDGTNDETECKQLVINKQLNIVFNSNLPIQCIHPSS